MSAIRTVVILLPLTTLLGCASPDEGFSLPVGDAQHGKEAFVALRCYDCHEVQGVELPARAESKEPIVKLGGEVTRAKKYSDLVTGIINPSHRLAAGYSPPENAEEVKSPMKVYNDVMTVAQLVDIVTFLQSHYQLRPYEPTPYPIYYP
jgi:L-cysteine S-thiosulfotransferase